MVAAAAVGGPFVLTVAAIAIVPATLRRRSAAAAASSALSWASLLHVVPISVVQAMDYLSDVIVAVSLLQSDGQQSTLGWIAVCALGLSIVFAWVSLVGFWMRKTRTAHGHDQQLEFHQLLIAALLAPLNLHVLYLGVVYSHAAAAQGGEGGPAPKSLRSHNAGWYFMFVTLKLLETSIESVPLAVMMVAAIVTGGSAGSSGSAGSVGSVGSVLLCASLSITLLSMSYGLFLQASRVGVRAGWALARDAQGLGL